MVMDRMRDAMEGRAAAAGVRDGVAGDMGRDVFGLWIKRRRGADG